jgi:hypothetical protein
LTRGRAAATDPFDIGAVSRSDELFDALAARRLADLGTDGADPGDPAVGLLAALVADVDKDAPPLPAPARVPCGGPRRRGVRAVVTFGVAALVLTSAGAAAAGGNNGSVRALDTPHGPGGLRTTERSNENIRHQEPAAGLLYVARRPALSRRHNAPETSGGRSSADRPARRTTRKDEKPGDKNDQGDRPNKTRWGKAQPTPSGGPSSTPTPPLPRSPLDTPESVPEGPQPYAS